MSESAILSNMTYTRNAKRIGTPLFLSPEVIRRQPYDHRSDVWSLGVVLYNVASLELPFQGDTMEQVSH